MGIVYIIRAGDTDLYKIGYTECSPESRRASLQTGNPHPLHVIAAWDGTMSDEKKVHGLLDCYRREGEWFELTIPNLVALICRYDVVLDTVEDSNTSHFESTARKCSSQYQFLLENVPTSYQPFEWCEEVQIIERLGIPFFVEDLTGLLYCVREGFLLEKKDRGVQYYQLNPELSEEGFEFFWEILNTG